MKILEKIKQFTKSIARFFSRFEFKRRSARSIFFSLVGLFVALIIAFAIAIYGFNVNNSSAKFMARIIPYPAVKVNWSLIPISDYNFTYDYTKHFYDASKTSYDVTTVKKQVIDLLITDQLTANQATKNKIKVSQDEVNQAYQKLQEKSGKEELAKVLTDLYGLNEDQFKNLIAKQLLKNKVQAWYQDKKQWREVQVRHLLVKVDSGADQKTIDAAQVKAKDYLKQINGGKPFADMAKQYSEDTASNNNSGELGYLSRGQSVAEFDDAIFASSVKKGDILGPIRTTYGWHLILIEDIRGDNDFVIWKNAAKVHTFIGI
ncbi:MAG: peptidylprolyl isomerase [Patescibacteria group bacterium]|jgi:parvulin-like peptidyl-prolyl isomerase